MKDSNKMNSFSVTTTFNRSSAPSAIRPDIDRLDQKVTMIQHRAQQHDEWSQGFQAKKEAFEQDATAKKCALVSFLREVLVHHEELCRIRFLESLTPGARRKSAELVGRCLVPEDELKLFRLLMLIQKLMARIRTCWEQEIVECWRILHSLSLFQRSALERAEEILFELDY